MFFNFSHNFINIFLIILLIQTIKISANDMQYEPYYYHGQISPNGLLSTTRLKENLMINHGKIVRRSPEFNNRLETSDNDHNEGDVSFTPAASAATTAKSPFNFFINFGGNDWLQTTTTKRPLSEEDSYEEISTDRIIHDDRRPFNHDHHNHHHPPYYHPPPTTTPSYPFFGGFRFGAPPENPFTLNNINNNNNNFFNTIENNNRNNTNPLLRGGIIIGSPPQFDNPLKPNYSDKDEETPTTKAKFWCEKYQTICSTKTDPTDLRPRIIGGNPASPKDHTYMVMIGYGTPDDKHWLCGGSLISSKFVLSAAHCTKATKWGKARWARLGDLDLSSKSDDASPQERMIVKRYNHPDYREPAVYNDIAIYKLDNEITMTDWVSPVCLQLATEIPIAHVVVTGWGRTAFVSDTSSMLMEVQIGLYNDSECKKLLNHTRGSRLPRGIDTRIMLCAGVDEGGKDACSGDSGGPLITETARCSRTQVGITSIGRECGLPNSPGIYTRISYYIPWIVSIVWP